MRAIWERTGRRELPTLPHVYDPIYVHGEALPIYLIRDGMAITEDEAGMRFTFLIDRLTWDDTGGYWRQTS